MDFKVYVKNRRGMIANVYRAHDTVVDGIRQAMRRGGSDVRKLAFQLAAFRTGFMRSTLSVVYSPDGLVFEVLYDPEQFTLAGLPYYPPYVEWGTVNQEAQPALVPAHEALEPFIQNDIRQAIRQGLRESSV